jgi:TatD-related deoxyribonuclease
MKIDTITDNHMHIDPINGLGIEAAKRFKRSGGTCLFLVNKTSKDFDITIEDARDFEESFNRTISLKNQIIDKTRLDVFAVIGVHPAEFAYLCGQHGSEKALEISIEAVEIAGQKIEDGSATALGEVGRPNYLVEDKIIRASNQLMERAMVVARDVGCAIQIHTESYSEGLFEDLSNRARKSGIKPIKVVKHFCGPEAYLAEKNGLTPSVLASRENVLGAPKTGTSFLLESDYIDDNKRPGAVLGPKTVPRLTLKLLEKGLLSIESAEKIHRDKVEKVYGIELG